MKEELKRWREKLKSGLKYKNLDDIGGKKGESKCDMSPKLEKAIVYRLKRNKPKREVCRLKKWGE